MRRVLLGEILGIDGLKILVPSQKAYPVLNGKPEEEQRKLLNKYNSKYSDGYYVHINEDIIAGVEDLYNVDIYADILMIDSTLPNIALAYSVADCPVVIAQDNKKNVATVFILFHHVFIKDQIFILSYLKFCNTYHS